MRARRWSVLAGLVAVLAAVALVAAACGGDDDTAASGGTTAAAASGLKVGLVSDVGKFNDRSFNQSGLEGLTRAESELGVEGRPIESAQASDYIPNLTTLARGGYDLTIGQGFLMADAINTVAGKFPDSNFAIVDFPNAGLKNKPANVRGLTFATNENSYLIGYMAAKVVKEQGGKQVISAVGGQEIPTVTIFLKGYEAGAQGRQPQHHGADGLLAGVRQAGEVQGDRPRSDRQGLAGGLPGRGRLRPRRALRGGRRRRLGSGSRP